METEEEMEGAIRRDFAQRIAREEEDYISEELNYFQSLIESSDLPEYAKQLLYGLFDKTTVLSNYNMKDIRIILAMADSLFADILIYLPPERITPTLVQELDNIKLLHYKMVMRAREGFERKQQRTRISQIEYGEERIKGEEKKSGFWNWLRRGG